MIEFLTGMAAAAALAQAGMSCLPEQPANYDTTVLKADGLVGTYYSPQDRDTFPAIMVLGGSEGGMEVVSRLGEPFAEQGYAVLSLAYFGVDGLPANLQEIPLEYFTDAIDWLSAQPGVDAGNIGLYGMSKGGEAALLIAREEPRYDAVVAAVPSHVVWQGINMQSFEPKSSWSRDSAPVPYVEYEMSDGFKSVYALYADALPAIGADHPAIIPVENIDAPILLVTGKADTMWPASEMADKVLARLDRLGFDHDTRHLAYDDAGHGVSVPPALGAIFGGPDTYVGGTGEGNAAGRADMWEEVSCFFRDTLKD